MLQLETIVSCADWGYMLDVRLSSTESYSQVVVEHKDLPFERDYIIKKINNNLIKL